MKLPPLQTSWDPPIRHQHFLLYLPTSSLEIRHCCWCWCSSVLVKYISLSGFSPTRSMSFDGLPQMRWKWNPLKWKQWSPERQHSTRKANWESSTKAGTQNKTNTRTFAIIRAPSIHITSTRSGGRLERCWSPGAQTATHLPGTAILSPAQWTP